jgi:fatty-acyl-CoA synthase
LGDEVFCVLAQQGKEDPITYARLWRETNRFAALYQARGIKSGETVLIILRHSSDLLFSFFGAILAGVVPSFMPFPTSKQDPQLYWKSHQKLFDRIGAGALLTYRDNIPALRQNLADLRLQVLVPEDAPGHGIMAEAANPDPDHIALLQHSSGTTGLKKGVALSHAAILAQIASYARSLALSPRDRIVSWLPLYHDMGLIACFILPLVTRTRLVLLDAFEWVANPTTLFDAIKLHQATLCWQPNFAFHHLCRTVRPSPRFDLSSMRAWIDCSEPCRAETFDLFAERFAAAGVRREHLQVCYAMAETVFAVTQTELSKPARVLAADATKLRSGAVEMAAVDSPNRRVLAVGRPIDGLEVRIVGESDQILGDRLVGEITIKGDCLFAGYYQLEAETRRKMREGWYHTGDLGFLHEGELYVTGRKNDLIIVHGRNYYAHELEFAVNAVPGVHPGRSVAVGWYRPDVGSEDVVIIAEVDPAAETARQRIAGQIKEALLSAAGLTVFDVHLVSSGWLIKTTSGKLSRFANLNKYLASIMAPNSNVAEPAYDS